MIDLNGNRSSTVLIADDEQEIQKVVKRYLARHGFESMIASNGREALSKAKTRSPGVILLDINMPEMDGLTVCHKLRENPSTRLTPILMLTARTTVEDKVCGLKIGADDYLTKPFDLSELVARIETLLRRKQRMIAASPLTLLPGGPTIQEEIEARIESGQKFGAAYIDIDNFKAYNDIYGYHQGDEVIKWTSKIIEEVLHDSDPRGNGNGQRGHFLGHIGGDDFILVADFGSVRNLCETVAKKFDQGIRDWYRWRHRLRGYIETKDRQGNFHQFPLMTLSIAVSTNEKRTISHYAQVAQITSELKKFAKDRAEKNKSFVVFDRRVS